MNSGDDEMVDVPSLPRWMRWAAWGTAVVLAGVVAAVVLTRHHSIPAARPAPVHTPSVVTRPPVPTRTDVAIAGRTRWELRGTTLAAASLRGGSHPRALPLPPVFASPAGEPRLVVDSVTHALWVVLEEGRGSRMVQVSATPLRIERDVRWPTAVYGAAAYAGHLYLATGSGVADLGPEARQPRLVPGLAGAVGPVGADPSRHRVIAIDLGFPTEIWSFGPHSAPVAARRTLALRDSTLTVAGGAIWILGRARSGAMMVRLDPKTLRPALRTTVPAHLARAAVLDVADDGLLWLVGRRGGGRLVCADPSSGVARQTWPIAGVHTVAAEHAFALISTGTSIQRIGIGRCRP